MAERREFCIQYRIPVNDVGWIEFHGTRQYMQAAAEEELVNLRREETSPIVEYRVAARVIPEWGAA